MQRLGKRKRGKGKRAGGKDEPKGRGGKCHVLRSGAGGLLKLVGSGRSDGWCGRQGSVAAVCRKKCSPGLVPPRLIGHVFLPFFMAPIAYLRGHILWIHSPRPICSWRRPRRRRPIIYLPNHTNLCSGSCFFGSLVMHNHGYISLFESSANPGVHVSSRQIGSPCHADRTPASLATGTPLCPEDCLVVSSTHPQLCSSRCDMHRCERQATGMLTDPTRKKTWLQG